MTRNPSDCAEWSTLHRTQHMHLSFLGFAFWWCIILSIHLVTCAYNLAYSKLYWGFKLTSFDIIVGIRDIGMASQHYHTVAYIFMALTTVHGMCGILMIGGSIWHRKLVFLPRKRKHTSPNQVREEEAVASGKIIRLLSAAYHRVGSENGVFGVKGSHFHSILLCRELVEVVLQSAQAIRMSKYLPRLLLNRFYVILLSINCWSSLLIHSRWFWNDEARRRFAAILCDCILNLMTTIGISLIVLLSYVDGYVTDDFNWDLLNDDKWVAQMLNEARVFLVMSWSDLAIRVIFSLGLVASTVDMKALLSDSSKRKNRIGHITAPKAMLVKALKSTRHPFKKKKMSTVVPFSKPSRIKTQRLATRLSCKNGIVYRAAHVFFAGWGVVLLVLHFHASMQTPLHECTPKVYPMAKVLPSCYTVEFDCHELGVVGSRSQVKAEMERFDRSTAVKLFILHCASLEIPDTIRDFDALQVFTVYNSTIVDWGDSSSITSTYHPNLYHMSLVRVKVTNGILPLGLQAQNFPPFIRQLFFCETNLETFPDDIDSKWHPYSTIIVENSKLRTVPSSLIRIQPYQLILTGNPLTHLPPELFNSEIRFIYIGNTLIEELPQNVTPTILYKLDVTNTNISFFPSWIDSLIEIPSDIHPIRASGSIYCSDLNDIMSGAATRFSASIYLDQASLLMNASEANWELLRKAVDCSLPVKTTQYALEEIDALYALE